MTPAPSSRRPADAIGGRQGRLAALAVVAVLWASGLGSAAAHGTFIRGSVTLSPDPPVAGNPMVLTVDLERSNNSPVEGAKLVADLTPTGPANGASAGQPTTITLQEYKEPYGTYRAQFNAPPDGSYTLTVHDRTRRGEDATASVPLRVGGKVANGDLGFTFPASGGTTNSVTRWLLWLVAIPVVAGVVVIILMRRANVVDEPDGEDET